VRVLFVCAVLLLPALAGAQAQSPSASAPAGEGVAGGSSANAARVANSEEPAVIQPPAAAAAVPAVAAPSAAATAGAPNSVEFGPPPAPPAQVPAPPPVVPLPTVVTAPAPVTSVLLPAPAAFPSVTPAPSSSAGSPGGAAAVRLGDNTVFSLRASRGTNSPADRARLAERALIAAITDERATDVKIVRQGDFALVYAGPVLIAQLGPDDARAAGDQSLDVLAGAVATEVRKALEFERNRRSLAEDVFSISLVVFLALIALFLAKKVGEVAERARVWLDGHGSLLAIRVQRIELVRPATLKSAALITIGLAKLLGQFGILFAWLVFVLSRFESTRAYTDKLTGFLVRPLSDLVSRVATALPLVVLAAIAALAVFVLVRFVGLFLASVERRDATLSWLPPDLAAPTSILIRVGIVISALVFAAPVVTGDPEGGFARAGFIALVALGLSSTPLLACGLVGAVVIFGRRLRVGEHVEIGGRLGRISELTLFDLRLQTSERSELRVPHLALLRQPLSALGVRPRLSVEIAVSAVASPTAVVRLLEDAGANVGRDVSVELLAVDADGAHYRINATCDSLEGRTELARNLVEALAAAAVPLGRGPLRARAS
jgi:small-conductance mechanosensitive channel